MSARRRSDGSRPGSRAGVSLVEVLVAMTIFAVLILALLGTSQLGLRLTIRAQDDVQLWAAIQRTSDSLMSLDPGLLSSGSRTVGDYDLSWAPTGAAPGEVRMIVRYQQTLTGDSVADTLGLRLR